MPLLWVIPGIKWGSTGTIKQVTGQAVSNWVDAKQRGFLSVTLKRNSNVLGTVSVALFLSCATACFGQSLGDVARQERERKEQEPRRSNYVYTNDDLKRPHILVPEDQQRVLARKKEEQAGVDASNLQAPLLPATAPDAAPNLTIGSTAVNLAFPLGNSAQTPVIPDLPALPADAVEPPNINPVQRRSRRSDPPAISMSLGISTGLAAPAASFVPLLSPKTEPIVAIENRAVPAATHRDIAPPLSLREIQPALVTLSLPSTLRVAPPPMEAMGAMSPTRKAPAAVSREIASPLTLGELQPALITLNVPAVYRVAKPSLEIETMGPTRKSTAAVSRGIASPLAPRELQPAQVSVNVPAAYRISEPSLEIETMNPTRKSPAASSREIVSPLTLRELQPAPVTMNVRATYRVAAPPRAIGTMNPTSKTPASKDRQPMGPVESHRGLALTHFAQPAEHSSTGADIRADLRATIRAATRETKPAEPIAGFGIRVERGDSLWRLAAKHLGSGTLWRELAALNPNLSNPNLIRIGQWIKLPEA